MTKKIGPVGKVAPAPKALPDPGETTLEHDEEEEEYDWPHLDKNAEIRTGTDTCFSECRA